MNEQHDVTVIARIEKLERENRRLKRIGIAVLLVSSMGLLMGQAKAPAAKQSDVGWEKRSVKAGTIQAGRIELVTPEGQVRATLGTAFGASELNMFDGDGKARISLSTQAEPGLYMGNLKVTDRRFDWLHSGKLNVQLTPLSLVLANETRNVTTLNSQLLLMENGEENVAVGMSSRDPAISSPGSAFINLASDDALMRVGRTGGYHTQIGTTELVTPSTGGSHKTSPASVVLFNDKGNAIWRAP